MVPRHPCLLYFLEHCFEGSGVFSILFVYINAQACTGCRVTLCAFPTLLVFLLCRGSCSPVSCLPTFHSYLRQDGSPSEKLFSASQGRTGRYTPVHNLSFPFIMVTAFSLDSHLDLAHICKLCPRGRVKVTALHKVSLKVIWKITFFRKKIAHN